MRCNVAKTEEGMILMYSGRNIKSIFIFFPNGKLLKGALDYKGRTNGRERILELVLSK